MMLTPPRHRNRPARCDRQVTMLLVATAIAVSTGCSTLDVPMLTFKAPEPSHYIGVDSARHRAMTLSEQAYHGVRQARSQNSIVLQVVDDSSPVRVLPLPSGERCVYISDLLEQTGVQKKLGKLEVTLFRHASTSIEGIPLEIQIDPETDRVRPESDYALRAGDRIRVQKGKTSLLSGLVGGALGL